MLTKQYLFAQLRLWQKALVIVLALVPFAFLGVYTMVVVSNIDSIAPQVLSGEEVVPLPTVFFNEVTSASSSALIYSEATLSLDPTTAYEGNQSLLFNFPDKWHVSRSYFNSNTAVLNIGDTLEFYVRNKSGIFNASATPGVIGIQLSYSGASDASQIMDITSQFPGNIVTERYQKISIPREQIAGNFNGKFRRITLIVASSTIPAKGGQSFYMDSIVLRRKPIVINTGQTTNTTTTTTAETSQQLNLNVEGITSKSVNVKWQPVSGAVSYNVYIAPEPELLVDISKRKLIANVPATASSYFIDNLAANSTLFVRVEAVRADNTISAKHFYAKFKTIGGPKQVLSSPLRETSLMAPNVLRLVMENKKVRSFAQQSNVRDNYREYLGNYYGLDWQKGSWEVYRNDGSKIGVVKVNRESVPVDMPYYEVGYKSQTYDELFDMDHSIYLTLDQNVGSNEILTIKFKSDSPTALSLYAKEGLPKKSATALEVITYLPKLADMSITLPFSDRYLETPVIQLNQVGYNPRATQRWAYISGWLGDGGALSLANFPKSAEVLRESGDNMEKVIDAPIAVRSSVTTNEAGTYVNDINLAALPASESAIYRVRIPGVGISWPTQVSEQATLKAFYTITRFLYHNRFGRDLKAQWTDWSTDNSGPDHTTIYQTDVENDIGFFSSATTKANPMTYPDGLGGHHDAGDYDINLQHYLVPMMLLRTYSMNSNAFSDGQLNIPESGNGIPDIIDEALWNIKGWANLQRADGGVSPHVESYRHPWGIYLANNEPNDQIPFWSATPDPIHTARIAGLFAQASKVVAPFNAAKANDLKSRAIKAYNYARSKGVTESSEGPMFYACSELFALTGEQSYKNCFEKIWLAKNWGQGVSIIRDIPWATSYTTSTQPALAAYAIDYLKDSRASSTIVSSINSTTGKAYKYWLARINAELSTFTNVFRNGRTPGSKPSWGTDSATGRHLLTTLAFKELGLAGANDQKYFDYMSLSFDYFLGGNPMGMSYVSGLGTRKPEQPLQLDSMTLQKVKGLPAIPGIVVYGPVDGLPATAGYDYLRNVYYPAFTARPALKRMPLVWTAIGSMEFTIQETIGSQVYLTGALLAPNLTVPASWKPGQANSRNPLPTAQ